MGGGRNSYMVRGWKTEGNKYFEDLCMDER
jgi:hypothetical protein